MTIDVSPTQPFHRSPTVTRSLLGCGVVVGPLYLVVGAAQGLLRPGGTPLGPPTSISTMGLMHFVVNALAFTCFGGRSHSSMRCVA